MTTSIWDEMTARRDWTEKETVVLGEPAFVPRRDRTPISLVNDMVERGRPYTGDEEGCEEHPLYDPDYDCPTYDEWKRADNQRRENDEQRHERFMRH